MSRYVSHHPTNYWGYKSSPTDMAVLAGDVFNKSPKVGTSIPSPDITSGGIGDLFGDVWGFPHHPWYVSNCVQLIPAVPKKSVRTHLGRSRAWPQARHACVKWPPFCGSDMAWKPLNIHEFMSIFPQKKSYHDWGVKYAIFQTRPYFRFELDSSLGHDKSHHNRTPKLYRWRCCQFRIACLYRWITFRHLVGCF